MIRMFLLVYHGIAFFGLKNILKILEALKNKFIKGRSNVLGKEGLPETFLLF